MPSEHRFQATWKTGTLVLRFIHLILHLLSIGLIVLGISSLEMKTGRHLQTAISWAALETTCCLMSTVIVILALIIPRYPTSSLVTGFVKFQVRYPNTNFFYYVCMSILIIYGAMVGCTIPNLFNPQLRYEYKPKTMSLKTWQMYLIFAVVSSIYNALLYLIGVYFPLTCTVDDNNGPDAKDFDRSSKRYPSIDLPPVEVMDSNVESACVDALPNSEADAA